MNQQAVAGQPPKAEQQPEKELTIREVGLANFFAWCARQLAHNRDVLLQVTIGGATHFGLVEGFDLLKGELTLNRGGAYGTVKICSGDLTDSDVVRRVNTREYLLACVAYAHSSNGRMPLGEVVDPSYYV